MIGGPGHTVEIVECLLVRRKYNAGHRGAATLLPIIHIITVFGKKLTETQTAIRYTQRTIKHLFSRVLYGDKGLDIVFMTL